MDQQTEPKLSARMEAMEIQATVAADYLKTLSHRGRLLILCSLHEGEKSVGELESLLDARQAAVSQHLARLRHEGMVTTRREGKTIFYRLADDRTTAILNTLYRVFCKPAL